MSATEVLVDKSSGEIIDPDVPNSIHRALKGDFVGRDVSGAPTAGQRLGTPIIPWGDIYGTNLILDGVPVDPALVTAPPNRVVSGAVRSSSEFPDYLRPAGVGGGASFTVLGATTTLKIDVNGTLADITTDIVKSGLVTGPSSNNTCKIFDVSLIGQDNTRFLGENGSSITVFEMESSLTDRIGEFVALLNQTTGEIFYCRIASSSKLDFCRRGFFFDDAGDPIPAGVLDNGDVLQRLSISFIFAEDDGVSIDVSYFNPVISGVEPVSLPVGQYWYDLNLNVWKRSNGSIFVEIDRTFIGTAAIDVTDCIGTRPEYFSKGYRDTNTLSVSLEDLDTIISDKADFIVSVDGKDKRFDFGFFKWDASTDFESGFTRTASRDYWLYVTEDGKPIISGYKPYDSLGFQRGWYHPYESWRAVAEIFNTSADKFTIAHNADENLADLLFNTDVEFFDFITLSNGGDALHDIDTSAGKFILDNITRQFAAPAFTKRLDATWAQGTDNGGMASGVVLAANATRHYFTLSNTDGSIVDFGADSSLSAANLLADAAVADGGLTEASYQGSIVTDVSSNIIPFIQHDRWFWLNPRIRLFSVGFIGHPAGPTLVTMLPIPTGLKVKAKINVTLETNVPSSRTAIFADPDLTNFPPNSVDFNFIGGSNTFRGAELDIMTNTSAQISEQWSSTGVAGQYTFLNVAYENLNLKR